MHYLLSTLSYIKAAIQLPASKSTNNRALIIHALSKGNDMLSNLSDCGDTKVVVKAPTEGGEVIDILVVGTAMRFLIAHLGSTPGAHIIIGMEWMQQRFIQISAGILWKLGASIEYIRNEGFPPLRTKGTLPASNGTALRGNASLQHTSALLMIGPTLKNGLQLRLTGRVVPRPYINLTLQLMKDFGVSIRWTSNQSISVEPQPYRCISFTAESDWSAASY